MQNVEEKRSLTLGFNWKAKVCFPSTRSFSLTLRSLPLSIKGLLSNSSSNSEEFTQKQVFEQEGRQNLSNIQPSFPISTFYYYESHTQSNLNRKHSLPCSRIKPIAWMTQNTKLLACYREEGKTNEPKVKFYGGNQSAQNPMNFIQNNNRK